MDDNPRKKIRLNLSYNIASARECNYNFNAAYGSKYFTMNDDADNAASYRMQH